MWWCRDTACSLSVIENGRLLFAGLHIIWSTSRCFITLPVSDAELASLTASECLYPLLERAPAPFTTLVLSVVLQYSDTDILMHSSTRCAVREIL